MQGRWIISRATVGHEIVATVGGPDCDSVPVVPCDDAAIERVAFMLWRLRVDCRNLKLEDDRDQLQGFAQSLLEAAAGETP